MLKLCSPKNGAEISVMTALQRELARLHREGKRGRDAIPEILKAEGEREGLSAPAEAIFSWKCDDPTVPMTLDISERADFVGLAPVSVGMIRQSAEDGAYFVPVTNFCVGRTYFWRVICGDMVSETRSFTTPEGQIRTVRVENVPNFRDLGGKRTESGKKVKQGLLYRGTFLENEDGRGLTRNGTETFVRELGIRTEIDLREESYGKVEVSPAGEEVRLVPVPFDSSWGGTLNDRGMGQMQMIFAALSDETAYPIYYHCHAGADRTGFLSVAILYLLGVPEEEIRLDYDFTALHEYRRYDTLGDANEYFSFLDEKYPGHTRAELVYIHLTEYGIDPSKIEKLREIMLED